MTRWRRTASHRVEINPNVRVAGNRTYVRLDDFEARPQVGDTVDAFQPEYGIVGRAIVDEIVDEHNFVFLAVDWDSFEAEDDRILWEGLVARLAASTQAGVVESHRTNLNLHDDSVYGDWHGNITRSRRATMFLATNTYSFDYHTVLSNRFFWGLPQVTSPPTRSVLEGEGLETNLDLVKGPATR